MGDRTGIEWTDATWNPLRGCSRVSEGCRHCYAEHMAARFAGPGQAYEGLAQMTECGPHWTGKVQLVEEHLADPLRWTRPRKVFVNSMSDLFHPAVPDEWIDRIFAVMALTPQHTYQILTKRPERMLRYLTTPVEGSLAGRFTVDGQPASDAYVRVFSRMVESYPNVQPDALNRATDWLDSHFPDGDGFLRAWPLPNVWLGVSVEHQQAADDRIPFLLQTPAAVRFLSCEPLLGPVKLPPECFRHFVSNDEFGRNSPLIQKESRVKGYSEVPDLLHWIIVGGESGPGARPMHPDWVRSIRDQCQAAGVPFFFKQWGEFADLTNDPPGSPLLLRSTETHVFTADGEVLGAGCRDQGMVSPDWREKGGAWMARVGKKAAGHLLDGREWREWPDGLR